MQAYVTSGKNTRLSKKKKGGGTIKITVLVSHMIRQHQRPSESLQTEREYETDNSDLLLSLGVSVSYKHIHMYTHKHTGHSPLEAAGCWCISTTEIYTVHTHIEHWCELSVGMVSEKRPPGLSDSWWTGCDIQLHSHWDCRKHSAPLRCMAPIFFSKLQSPFAVHFYFLYKLWLPLFPGQGMYSLLSRKI